MSEKIWVPKSSAKEIQTKYGFVMKLSFDAQTLAEFAKEHKNDSGWITLIVSERREVGPKGQTHTIALDTWKPDGTRGQQAAPAKQQKAAPAPAKQGEEDFEEPPF